MTLLSSKPLISPVQSPASNFVPLPAKAQSTQTEGGLLTVPSFSCSRNAALGQRQMSGQFPIRWPVVGPSFDSLFDTVLCTKLV